MVVRVAVVNEASTERFAAVDKVMGRSREASFFAQKVALTVVGGVVAVNVVPPRKRIRDCNKT